MSKQHKRRSRRHSDYRRAELGDGLDEFDDLRRSGHRRGRLRDDLEALDEDEEWDGTPPRFDVDRWREDLTERSSHRERLRQRDLRRGILDPRHLRGLSLDLDAFEVEGE